MKVVVTEHSSIFYHFTAFHTSMFKVTFVHMKMAPLSCMVKRKEDVNFAECCASVGCVFDMKNG